MSFVGDQSNFVDTQEFTLTRLTSPVEKFAQITDMVFDIDSNVTKHQLTNDVIDNVYSLNMNSLQGNMWLTNSEWQTWVEDTKEINGIRPNIGWNIQLTDQSGNLENFTFFGQVKTVQMIDTGIGVIRMFFRIEGINDINIV